MPRQLLIFPLSVISVLLSLAECGFSVEPALIMGADGRLRYMAGIYGDVVPDFSHCGYRGGNIPLPDVPVVAVLEPDAGDDTIRIQHALEAAAARPPSDSGFRGTVLLKRGVYRIGDTLQITTSGVVLRGEGSGENGTVLRATARRQYPLIRVQGAGPPVSDERSRTEIVSDYVPVGAREFEVQSAAGYAPGDTVRVHRRGNVDWISAIGMDRIEPHHNSGEVRPWKPFSIAFDRIITAIDGARVTVDAPLVCAIERRWGGGVMLRYQDRGRVGNAGVEHLRLVSEFDPHVTTNANGRTYFADENHAWEGIRIDNAINVWARDIVAVHFGFGCVNVRDAKWVTVQDCACLDMVSRIEGSRRFSFYIYGGQLCLIRNCTAQGGRHDFAFGARAWGPNAFLDCFASQAFDHSEPHNRWSVGGLYDNVTAPIAVQDRWNWGAGHGWAGANYVLWNCEGPLIAQTPPFAFTWVFGHVGPLRDGYQQRSPASFTSFGRHVRPRSLYLQQLQERAGGQ